MYQAVLGTATATNRHNLKSHGHRPRGNGKLDRTERIVHEVKPLPRESSPGYADPARPRRPPRRPSCGWRGRHLTLVRRRGRRINSWSPSREIPHLSDLRPSLLSSPFFDVILLRRCNTDVYIPRHSCKLLRIVCNYEYITHSHDETWRQWDSLGVDRTDWSRKHKGNGARTNWRVWMVERITWDLFASQAPTCSNMLLSQLLLTLSKALEWARAIVAYYDILEHATRTNLISYPAFVCAAVNAETLLYPCCSSRLSFKIFSPKKIYSKYIVHVTYIL